MSSPVPATPRDRHAVRIPAPHGRRSPDRPRSVAVVGGGIAGLSAAIALAERGVQVTLLESADRLGGRVAAWPLPEDRSMSRGFHAFFRQYYNLRELLRRTDPTLERLTPVEDYPLRRADGLVDSFTRIPRTPPANLIGFVLRSPTFPLRALARIHLPSAIALIDVDYPAGHARWDGVSAAAFLDRLRFPAGARHLALEVFARSFFAHPTEFSASELVAMFHTYFVGSAEGLLFDVPTDDYDSALWAPLGRYLTDHGGAIRTDSPVTALEPRDGGWSVRTAQETLDVDAVVLAADPRTQRELVAALPERIDGTESAVYRRWREDLAAQRNAPPFGVLRLWTRGQVDPERQAFCGTSGYALLDNVTVLERYEDGALQWSREHDGSVLELHGYALDAERDPRLADPAEVRRLLLEDLHAVYPETAGLEIVHEELLIQDDCGLVDLAPRERQPGVVTPVPGLALAGDRIACDPPVALMERAATTGFLAANELLSSWGVRGHALTSPPLRGMLRRGPLGALRRTLRRR